MQCYRVEASKTLYNPMFKVIFFSYVGCLRDYEASVCFIDQEALSVSGLTTLSFPHWWT